jgi:hypothetical protein
MRAHPVDPTPTGRRGGTSVTLNNAPEAATERPELRGKRQVSEPWSPVETRHKRTDFVHLHPHWKGPA